MLCEAKMKEQIKRVSSRKDKISSRFSLVAIAVGSFLSASSHYAHAQEQTESKPAAVEIIEVRGVTEAYRNAIAEKRSADTIVDALSSADIGTLPDLSVAETLERITGVAGDRFKGNASEISIRGLGPFLGFSTVNGRTISSGAGNRSVAFTQFPSELVNGVVVYKAQKADLLEGGVAGTIDLKTIKPIDYGKKRFQTEVRLNYNPYHNRLNDENGVGTRPTFSYTNSHEFKDGSKFGYAFGYAGTNVSTPEESFNTSATLRNCNSDFAVDGGSNCSFRDSNSLANGGSAENGDFYFISNQFLFRQNDSEEDRDAAIFALQYQPNANVDINLDGQFSRRFFFEDRHDLVFDDGRRRIANPQFNDQGGLLSFTGESRITSLGEFRERNEDYRGVGLNIDWQVSDRLGVEIDTYFNGTKRFQTRTFTRFRSDRFFYDFQNNGSEAFPSITAVYDNFNDPEGTALDVQSAIQDLSFFDADSQARNIRFDINDEIRGLRFDVDYALDSDIFTYLKAGINVQQRTHNNFDEDTASRNTPSGERASQLAAVAENCSVDFPQSDFGSDANATFTQWATYDTRCAFNTLIDNPDDLAVDPSSVSAGDVRLEEDIVSFYAMAAFSTEWGNVTVDGNVGIRYVTTDISSIGTRTSLSVVTADDGTISFTENNDPESNLFTNDYSNTLPSLNVNFGLTDDVQLRFAAYSAISRPDLWFYGAARDIRGLGADSDDQFTSIEEALEGNVTAIGNPFLEALESDNLDLSLSYFFGEDTLLSAAVYYKTFDARIAAQSAIEPVIVSGQTINVNVDGRPTIVDESSNITGLELTVQHKFTHLPAPFDGLGVVLNYNYANSNFETPEAGSNISDSVLPSIEPGNVPGLSEDTVSAQMYWEKGPISARMQYRYRSEYLKPFGNNLGQTNRYVIGQESLDVDIAYTVNKNLTARVQALNLTNEPYVERRVVDDAFNRIEYSGPRFFVGLRYRL
jgi:TonB-dependent receptor